MIKFFLKSISSCYLKPLATYLALYFKTRLSWSFFGLKHYRPVIACWFSGSGVIFQVSFSIRESYSAYIGFFYSGQSKKQVACLKVPGSSFHLLTMADFNNLSVCIKYVCDLAAKILVNLAELEDTFKLSKLEPGCKVSVNSALNIDAEP